MNRKIIAKRIRYYREQKNWSQEELAFNASLSRSSIGRLERGETMPKWSTIARIEEALGLKDGALLKAPNLTVRTPVTPDRQEHVLREIEYKLQKDKIPQNKDLKIVVSIQLEEAEE